MVETCEYAFALTLCVFICVLIHTRLPPSTQPPIVIMRQPRTKLTRTYAVSPQSDPQAIAWKAHVQHIETPRQAETPLSAKAISESRAQLNKPKRSRRVVKGHTKPVEIATSVEQAGRALAVFFAPGSDRLAESSRRQWGRQIKDARASMLNQKLVKGYDKPSDVDASAEQQAQEHARGAYEKPLTGRALAEFLAPGSSRIAELSRQQWSRQTKAVRAQEVVEKPRGEVLSGRALAEFLAPGSSRIVELSRQQFSAQTKTVRAQEDAEPAREAHEKVLSGRALAESLAPGSSRILELSRQQWSRKTKAVRAQENADHTHKALTGRALAEFLAPGSSRIVELSRQQWGGVV